MNTRSLFVLAIFAVVELLIFPAGLGPFAAADDALHPRFRVTSTTFQNDATIPATMIFNGTLGSVCVGGDMSPQLTWTKSLPWTRSYAVITYDVTANFTHWGIYNIPPDVTELPANASATTNYPQITDDAGVVGYAGPCPPPDIVPNGIHKYLFTVYALDTTLDLPAFPPGTPAPAETLFRAMLGHVIDTATITGLFSCNNSPTAGCS